MRIANVNLALDANLPACLSCYGLYVSVVQWSGSWDVWGQSVKFVCDEQGKSIAGGEREEWMGYPCPLSPPEHGLFKSFSGVTGSTEQSLCKETDMCNWRDRVDSYYKSIRKPPFCWFVRWYSCESGLQARNHHTVNDTCWLMLSFDSLKHETFYIFLIILKKGVCFLFKSPLNRGLVPWCFFSMSPPSHHQYYCHSSPLLSLFFRFEQH